MIIIELKLKSNFLRIGLKMLSPYFLKNYIIQLIYELGRGSTS